MREGWEIKKLGEVCETTSGGTPSKSKSEYYEGGNIPWLRSGEINSQYINSTELCITELGLNKSSAKWFPCDTVVIAMYGATVGQVGILKNRMTTNQAVCGILPNAIFKPDFLYYFLKSKKEHFINIANGGAQPNISQNVIKSTYVPIPPIFEQTRIVEELDLLNGILDKKRQQLKELDALSQSIFYDMFGDPIVNAKHWPLLVLEDICSKITDGTHDTPERLTKGIKFITGKHIQPNFIDFENSDYVTEEIHSEIYKRCNPQYGDILYTNIGNVGIAALNNVSYEFSMKNVALLKLYKNQADGFYVEFCLNNTRIKNKIILNHASGGVQKFLSLKSIKRISIPVPPITLQNEFADKIKSIERQKQLIKASIAETQTLLDSRMDYYFN